MSKIQIILNGHVDRDAITSALIADSSYIVEVVNNYSADGSENYNLDLNDLNSVNKEAFLKTLDNATYLIEQDAFVWVIAKSDKTFNVEASYVRNAVSTSRVLTALSDGTPLKLVFETPGFETNTLIEIDLWYNDDFNPVDVESLASVGIVLTGNGAEFSFTNTVPCKLYFKKPVAATEVYIIDYDLSNEVIAV